MKAGSYGFIVSVLLVFCFSSEASADWQDFWKTPEQRALQAYEEGEYEALLQDAPDEGWTGLGQFQSENYSEASEHFGARAAELQEAGDIDGAIQALYNQGVSDVMAGQFEQAIERFDQVLAEDPEFNEALVNRNIAEELLTLQQQPESDQAGEPGESGDQQQDESQDGEQSESESDNGEQSGDPSDDSQSQENAQQSDQDESSSSNSQDAENEEDAAAQNEAERQQEAEEAREALAAEAAQGDQDQQEDSSESANATNVTEQPMSEEEQATEQLLRRIPDDPAGLLRRKLEQSHRNEYPEVRNVAEPW